MQFNQVLDKYRNISFSQRDKGDRFERLMQRYLLTDPKYSSVIEKVWLWTEFPYKDDLGGADTGIDLVAYTSTAEYWAIQCKCYQETYVIDKAAVDSFLSTSGRKFRDDKGKLISFAHRIWISTTNHWGPNASEAIKNQQPAVTRINLYDLQQAPVDWKKLEEGVHGELSRTQKKDLRKHQQDAVELTHKHFKKSDRGKLIMACGTGKTFTSLRIAETETKGKGLVLFLVPSIALLGQTLREWSADAGELINPICICSDPAISRKRSKNEDTDSFSVVDLAMPASTDVKEIVNQFKLLQGKKKKGLTVVFSTYQSIDVVAKAQKELGRLGLGEFDLIICDEAHRTTGVALANEEESAFTKVHDNKFLKASKRLYMTATPRLYKDEAKSKAALADAVLCSMDDVSLYGDEIYRIGFGEAVERDLLTDYKVLILTLNEQDVPPAVQKMIADKDNEINTDDASKLIGCINALSKQVLGDEGIIKSTDPDPMRRAVAFCSSIAVSKKVTTTYNTATDAYISSLPDNKQQQMVSLESRHIDGTMAAPQRDELLGWLKDDPGPNECRILTNVRCLSEGVDVPSLDAVMFLSARNSEVDVVQSVGRVMRKAPNKKYGYIIIPVVVPGDVEAEKALSDNERYKVVWTVLNALRAHDDRFNATINKIELNRKRPHQILVGRPEITFDDGGVPTRIDDTKLNGNAGQQIATQLALQFEQLKGVVFARMVDKVGDRRYWEQWAKSVAEIAERHETRIKKLIKENKKYRLAFDRFIGGLQKNINPNITESDAIEMLSQHLITAPVFEALFEGYSFVKNNPISQAMQGMLELLEKEAMEKDTESLEKFYDSVRKRAEGIDNTEGKQKIILELYEKYFKTALPKMVDRLGIVYTPVEVVDFIIHSANDILEKEFGRTLSDENVHILDPFTGTGTFITRLIQSGLLKDKDLKRKYHTEIHANEIVLLAYYIAAVNIENAYHDALASKAYEPFEGICLTDTFQLGETEEGEKLFSDMFPQNSERVARQKKAPLRVILGNPPYSVGQKSANDNAQNQKYEKLDARIAKTYAAETSAGLNKSLYDAYIKAFRWSTDRLDKDGGIICFVSNGQWLDVNSTDGFRKCLEKEFSSIYVFNLRGNQRTSGELSRKEGGKIFGSGSRTPIAITLLVKKPSASKNEKADIKYYDIGDYLSREQKLLIIREFKTFGNPGLPLITLEPNEHGDWISMRNDSFSSFIPTNPVKKFDKNSDSFFLVNGPGISSGRDSWVYNHSKKSLKQNVKQTIDYYNEQRTLFIDAKKKNPKIKAEEFIDTDLRKISWTVNLKSDIIKNYEHKLYIDKLLKGLYRPFTKQHLYYDKALIERPGLNRIFFPDTKSDNIVIAFSGVGSSKDFSTFVSGDLTSYDLLEKTQCLPLYYFEESLNTDNELFNEGSKSTRRDAITDFILNKAQKQYSSKVTKEDIFYYVYGFLHSPEYRETFANDLKKSLPRLPLVEKESDFWAFSQAGRKLADLHLNYEQVPAYEGVTVSIPEDLLRMDAYEFYRVEKMRFPKKGEKGTIIYNSRIVVENIPEEAYDYIVNGKSAIEWIMERYQVTVHKESGIKNDPNDWSKEHEQPSYIFDLLLSIINVSMQTVEIVRGLPKVKF